jgi:hypothetical protein
MIGLSDQTKILILVAIIGIVIFFFIQNRVSDDEETHNEGSLTQSHKEVNMKNISEEDDENKELADVAQEIMAEEKPTPAPRQKRTSRRVPNVNEAAEVDAAVLRKFRTRNGSRDGTFRHSSYVDGRRGGGRASDLDKFFEEGHPLDRKVGFQKNDPNAADIQYANYIPGKQRKLREVDKFNAEALLPKEKHKDWFDDPYESTSVKNTHLINIYRPIGINTISTTLKNPSWDIRGTPSNPKYVASPFLNSSWEPDTNLRNQSLCY